jgi:hypothetical protein
MQQGIQGLASFMRPAFTFPLGCHLLVSGTGRGKFKLQDLEKDVQGNMNWEKWAVAEKTKMIKSG